MVMTATEGKVRLTATDRMALDYLCAAGSDCVGEIDSDEKLAAALVYSGLVRAGFVMCAASEGEHPTFYPTKAGRAALSPEREGGADG